MNCPRCFCVLFLLALSSPVGFGQVVSLSAPVAQATEAGVYPGTFRIDRTGATDAALTVNLTYSGNATAGSDYDALPATVTIPAGQTGVDLTLSPINDSVDEAGDDVVTATVQAGAGYSAGSPASASITIVDDETFTNTSPLHYWANQDSPTAITLFWVDNFETETKYRVQYRLAGVASWTTIDNLPANSTSYKITGLTTGQVYEFRVNAYQGTTASLNQTEMRQVALAPSVLPPAYATFEQWRQATGLDGASRWTAGKTSDDPDSDGQSNLIEYALGTNPLAPNPPTLQVGGGAGGSLQVAWPQNSDLLDVSTTLEETTDLTSGWQTSPLTSNLSNGTRVVTDSRGGTARFYRVKVSPAAPVDPSSVITCWGDSLTGNPGTYAEKLPTLLAGNRTVQNCGIGGDTSIQIADRVKGLQLTAPYPAYSANSTASGTSVRLVASRTTHSRIMNTGNRGSWATYSSTIANASRVEFFNFGRKIGESSTPLSTTVTSNRTASATRLIAPGHPFSTGDVVHFPAGPLPSPLVISKPYYVRDADAGGFSLAEADVQYSVTANSTAPSTRFVSASHPYVNGDAVFFREGGAPPGYYPDRYYYVRDSDTGGFSLSLTQGGAAISMIYSSTGAVLGKPGPAISLAANFASATTLQGPFVLNWSHPGGPTSLTIRTHTDRDKNTFIFWMGRNNNARPHEVYQDLHSAIDQIKSLNGRFLVVSVTNGGGESAGSPYYYNTVNYNALLRAEFPNEFVDVRTALIRSASSDANDQIDRAADIPPRSLRSDNVHFNDAGQQIIANILAAEITRRGW